MKKKNKYIIEIPIETHADKREIEDKVKSILCDYEIGGSVELDHPVPEFDTKKTVIDFNETKVKDNK